jgi:FMN phosphatase YigB (HAD superfamily)
MTTLLFDLDGTLLPLRLEELAKPYLHALTIHWGPLLAKTVAPETLPGHVLAATAVMMRSANPARPNREVYWEDLAKRIVATEADLRPSFVEFYRDVFPKLRRNYEQRLPGIGRSVVQAAVEQGFDIVLATNPIWPREAIKERMRWAGLEDLPWLLISSYEDFHFCKPHPGYFQEICEKIARPAEQCWMIGNDVDEDGVAAKVGMKVFMTSDWLENRSGSTITATKTGTLNELLSQLQRGQLESPEHPHVS